MTKRRNIISRFRTFYVIGIIVAIFSSAAPAFGQFIVQPMRMEMPARAGQLVRTELQLQNHDPEETINVELYVVELSQSEDGSWQIIAPADVNDVNNLDISQLQSCREWISLSKNIVDVRPVSIETIDVNVRVKGGTRGFYSAAILVRLVNPNMETEIRLIFQFIIPVIINIQGRAPLRKVEISDMEMEFHEAAAANPATTVLSMNVENKGGTYSRLRGLLKLWGHFGEHWRLFAEREIRVPGILPGAKLKLTTDIERTMPPGRYRIAGALLVDGRRSGSVKKTIEFAGDPKVTKIAADAALNVEPKEITIDSLPGSTRTRAIKVSNASDEAVDVRVALALPAVLRGVAFGPLFKGEDLNCSEWLQILPKKFRLPAYGQQNIQIVATVPNPEMVHPCYYSTMGLFATYPDGQNAGLTTAQICVVNQISKDSEIQPQIRSTGPLNIANQSGSKYIVSIVYGNYGKIHFTPRLCKAVVINTNNMPMTQERLDAEQMGIMLPFEFRAFSGLIDFSEYPEGMYRIEVDLEYTEGEVATTQLGIEVSIEGEQRVIKALQQGEFERRMGVQWR